MRHDFPRMKINESEKGSICACGESGSEKSVDQNFFSIGTDKPFGLERTILINVKENIWHVTLKLHYYSTCILRAEVRMNCTLCFQVSILGVLKEMETGTNKSFLVRVTFKFAN